MDKHTLTKTTNPQNVLDYPNNNTFFLTWNLKEDLPVEELQEKMKGLYALVMNLNHSALNRFPDSKASCTLGIGHDAWLKLALPTPLPKELENFIAIKGVKHTAVSTKGDLHLHIRADKHSFAYDMAAELSTCLTSFAECVVEVQGFRYWDSRSILGFVDGTENPHGAAREYFAIIDEQDPKYKGGSYLFVQKYIHDLQAWDAIGVSDQENVIGRSKTNDIEMSDAVKPKNSHSALANIGDDFKIVRDNMPFGNVSSNEMGTYFLCYASTFSTVKKMLEHMFIGNPKGNYDRILDFSTAKTGALFFVPSMDMLSDWAG
ncbi:Dyp-type peroxidase [Sphingobacterium lactis]|uniref:Dyp-type peroxidase n=1 Tax=Sphingobacterium lactis TaxID=797291 RepID=UPI003F805F0A